MSKGSLRDQMPVVAAWVDDLRSAFGTEYINGIIKSSIDNDKRPGAPVFYASENGNTIGTPVPQGSRVLKDVRGNPYILERADGKTFVYDPSAGRREN